MEHNLKITAIDMNYYWSGMTISYELDGKKITLNGDDAEKISPEFKAWHGGCCDPANWDHLEEREIEYLTAEDDDDEDVHAAREKFLEPDGDGYWQVKEGMQKEWADRIMPYHIEMCEDMLECSDISDRDIEILITWVKAEKVIPRALILLEEAKKKYGDIKDQEWMPGCGYDVDLHVGERVGPDMGTGDISSRYPRGAVDIDDYILISRHRDAPARAHRFIMIANVRDGVSAWGGSSWESWVKAHDVKEHDDLYVIRLYTQGSDGGCEDQPIKVTSMAEIEAAVQKFNG